jgi:hypothetical protein
MSVEESSINLKLSFVLYIVLFARKMGEGNGCRRCNDPEGLKYMTLAKLTQFAGFFRSYNFSDKSKGKLASYWLDPSDNNSEMAENRVQYKASDIGTVPCASSVQANTLNPRDTHKNKAF